ncbi:MAG: triphosphoribosyl-dephospho-CoA synthase [Candidatus Odinarchaeota archaeon]
MNKAAVKTNPPEMTKILEFITSLEEAVQLACLSELVALKPGNVNRYSDHEDTTIFDFILSSVKLIHPIRSWIEKILRNNAGIGLGSAILNTVNYQRQTGTERNTNLGIILVLYPLITSIVLMNKETAIEKVFNTGKYNQMLSGKIISLLESNGPDQAYQTVQAINMANPSGLGDSDQFDVKDEKIEKELSSSGTNLRMLFSKSSNRDLVCREYETGFTFILERVLPELEVHIAKQGLIHGIEITFLMMLSWEPDTHVIRRHGHQKALEVQTRATTILNAGNSSKETLVNLDRELKSRKINPGTMADLLVGGLFLFFLKKSIKGELIVF